MQHFFIVVQGILLNLLSCLPFRLQTVFFQFYISKYYSRTSPSQGILSSQIDKYESIDHIPIFIDITSGIGIDGRLYPIDIASLVYRFQIYRSSIR